MAENEVEQSVNNSAEDFGLNEKQKRFCEYYVKSQSAGASYKKAYGDDMDKELTMGSCYTNGSKLLKSDKIKNYLNILRKETKKKNLMEVDEILGELVDIATHHGTKTSDKLRALELIGKYHNIWQEKLTIDQNSTVEINLVGMEEERKIIESQQPDLIGEKNGEEK